jgi:hypothetical protein
MCKYTPLDATKAGRLRTINAAATELDLLPLLELLDNEPDTEMLGPVVPPEFEMPGPELSE